MLRIQIHFRDMRFNSTDNNGTKLINLSFTLGEWTYCREKFALKWLVLPLFIWHLSTCPYSTSSTSSLINYNTTIYFRHSIMKDMYKSL